MIIKMNEQTHKGKLSIFQIFYKAEKPRNSMTEEMKVFGDIVPNTPMNKDSMRKDNLASFEQDTGK